MDRTLNVSQAQLAPSRWPFSLLLVAGVQLAWAGGLLALIAVTIIAPNQQVLSAENVAALNTVLNLGRNPLPLLLVIPAIYHAVFGIGLLGLQPWARTKLAYSCGIAVLYFARSLMYYNVVGDVLPVGATWGSDNLRGILYTRIAIYAISFLILMFHPSVIEAFPRDKD
jgi:hypothetical protein